MLLLLPLMSLLHVLQSAHCIRIVIITFVVLQVSVGQV
jgi:hypothetical protein